MRLTEYSKIYDDAITAIDNLIEIIREKTIGLTEDEIILSSENYYQILNDLYEQRKIYVQLRVRYLFDKMGKSEFERIIQSQEAGVNSRLLTVDYLHTIKDYETPQKVASLYGIDVGELFLYNAITIEDFDDTRERSGQIKVPTTINLDDNSKFTDLAVYGSVAGQNVIS